MFNGGFWTNHQTVTKHQVLRFLIGSLAMLSAAIFLNWAFPV